MTRTSMSVGWLAWLTLVLSVAVAWVLSRQPIQAVSGGAENMRGHAHMMSSGPSPPPTISAERWPHLVGIGFLTAHIVFVLLAVSLYGMRNALRRMGKPGSSFPARLIVAGVTCLAAAAATPVVAWIGLGDQPASQTLDAVIEVTRYTFAAAILFIALFGVPWRNPAHR